MVQKESGNMYTRRASPITDEFYMIQLEHLTHDLDTQGFHIIDDFLQPHDYETLSAQARAIHQNGSFRQAKIGSLQKAQHQVSIRSDEIYWLDEHAHEPSMKAFIGEIQTIAQHINHAFQLKIIELETHFAAYKPNTFYKMHRDQFQTNQRRKISCVYYLNQDWKESYGGDLKLYNPEEILIQSTYPLGNRFICFKSELPHEVCITHHLRYSIAGWLKEL
jgi:SM-20-related protein